MENEKTHLFKLADLDNKLVKETLKDVYDSLKERGYDPINQLVGYLISGDLGYISNYNDARNKIKKVDRAKILEVLLKDFQG